MDEGVWARSERIEDQLSSKEDADALSRSHHEPAPLAVAEDDGEVQISLISESSEQIIESLLEAEDIVAVPATLGEEQRKETELKEITDFWRREIYQQTSNVLSE